MTEEQNMKWLMKRRNEVPCIYRKGMVRNAALAGLAVIAGGAICGLAQLCWEAGCADMYLTATETIAKLDLVEDVE